MITGLPAAFAMSTSGLTVDAALPPSLVTVSVCTLLGGGDTIREPLLETVPVLLSIIVNPDEGLHILLSLMVLIELPVIGTV